jgi:hypothetical protein
VMTGVMYGLVPLPSQGQSVWAPVSLLLGFSACIWYLVRLLGGGVTHLFLTGLGFSGIEVSLDSPTWVMRFGAKGQSGDVLGWTPNT